jgi:hemoglobin/transferrin/lactoferrin receptor protein
MTDHQALSRVRVEIFSPQSPHPIAEGYTDRLGQYSLQKKWLKPNHSILLSHPGYHERKYSVNEVQLANFRLLLEPYTYEMEEVVFMANRHQEKKSEIPHQIQVIKGQDIQLRNPQTSADLLEQHGQVFVQKSQQGGGSPNLRGFEANKVLLVVDGIRMNNAIYRSGHLQNVITLDPAMIARTEVMFGPGSVIYGSDALGGVMHFYTRSPELATTSKIKVKFNASARYFEANQSPQLHADLNLGFRKWGLLSSVSWNRFGDIRIGENGRNQYPDWGLRPAYIGQIPGSGRDSLFLNPDPFRMVPGGYEQMDLLQKLVFVPNERIKHQFQVQYSHSSDIPRFDRLTQTHHGKLRFAEWYYGPQKRLLTAYNLTDYGKRTWYDMLQFTLAYQNLEESRINREFAKTWRNHREETVQVGSLNLDLNKTVKQNHFSYGAEIAYNQVLSHAYQQNLLEEERRALDTRYPDGGSQWWSSALYFTHRWEMTPRISLTEGIRLSDVRLHSQFVDTTFYNFPFREITQNNQALSGNLGWVFKLPRAWRISFLGATGFRAPNLDDVAKVFDSQPGNVVVPNPMLKPEYTYNLEFILNKRWDQQAFLELSVFHTWYRDAIVLRPAQFLGADSILYEGIRSQVQTNINAGAAVIWGGNINFWWQLADNWKLSHTLTYTFGQEKSSDVPMDHIPPLFGRTALQYANKAWKAELSMPFQGWKRPERYAPRDWVNAEFATEDGWPAWWVLNAWISRELGQRLKLQFGVNNLWDQHYRPFSSRISAPGRNLYLALRANF